MNEFIQHEINEHYHESLKIINAGDVNFGTIKRKLREKIT